MAGIIPATSTFENRLQAIGYREIQARNDNYLLKDAKAKGHEFHYYSFHPKKDQWPFAYQTNRGNDGYMVNQLVAGFTYIHFLSCLKMAENWIEACKAYRRNRK